MHLHSFAYVACKIKQSLVANVIKVSMTSKHHNYRQQTNLRHIEEETHNTNSNDTTKVKQPALSSPAR